MFNPIDGLIEYLKSAKPLDKTGIYKLWESFKALSDGISQLDTNFTNSLTINVIEIPKGDIDGANKKYLLSSNPVSVVIGYKNGLLLVNDIDFQVKDKLITMTVAPAISDVLQFQYLKRG